MLGMRLGRTGTLLSAVALAATMTLGGSAKALTCSEVRELSMLYFKLHFAFNTFDDELSRRTVDSFVKAWDPAKLYFLQSDVDEFEQKYNTKLDDQIPAGDCSAIDFIMQRYAQRFEERQKKIYQLIDEKQDFTIDEYLPIDHKKIPWAKTVEEVNDGWRRRIKFQLLSLKQGGVKDEKLAREKMKKRYDLGLKRQNELTKDKVYEIYLNAFATALDPHSSYMPASELEDFRIKTRLSLEGIGASLRSEDGFTIVVSLVKGGAAEKGGLLKTGDKIIAVAQGSEEAVDVIDLDLQEVVKKIRGARGTTVNLSVIRDEASESKKVIVPIVREKIQLVDQQASSKVIELVVNDGGKDQKMKVGVVTLPSFYIDFEGKHKRVKGYRSSSDDTKAELDKMQKVGVDAVVMDLRSNGGGSLEESINVAGLFYGEGPVVQVKTQSGKIDAYADQDPKTYYKGPLLVIINRNSASASEIFAGAIQDYGRGLIVGDSHTFGKGSVQNLNDVAAKLGAIKVTVNKFYRASGASTQLDGVASDIRLPSLVDEFEIGEKYYDFAMPFDTIRGVPHQDFNMVKPYTPQLAQLSEKRVMAAKGFKEVVEEIKKFRENTDERSRVSLKEKKDDPADKGKDKKAAKKADPEAEDAQELALENDIYLQESLYIASDYVQLIKGKKQPGEARIPELVALEAKKAAEAKIAESAKKPAPDSKITETSKKQTVDSKSAAPIKN